MHLAKTTEFRTLVSHERKGSLKTVYTRWHFVTPIPRNYGNGGYNGVAFDGKILLEGKMNI